MACCPQNNESRFKSKRGPKCPPDTRDCQIKLVTVPKDPNPCKPPKRTLHENSVENRMPPACTTTSSLHPNDHIIVKSNVKMPEGDPCYMPRADDNLPTKQIPEPMGPIGPWATGRVDWGPLAGITGTRPVVDHYSITRYSAGEWRAHNEKLIKKYVNALEKSVKVENDTKNNIIRTFAMTDKVQSDSTQRLQLRAREVTKWKDLLENAIRSMALEISVLEEQRIRLKGSLTVLKIPEAIATECIDRRCSRAESELVRDDPEEELIREVAMIAEIRDLLLRTYSDIVAQQIENRTARERLEFDWSDKQLTVDIEGINTQLTNCSSIIMFYPGSTRFPPDQSSDEYYQIFSKETLEECEACRQKSVNLRGTLDEILLSAARDLRKQADVIDRVLAERISCMDEMRQKLENDLKECLGRIVENERLTSKLNDALKNMDFALKVAQTRLDLRNQRPRVENCRDEAYLGLMNEVQALQDGSTALLSQLKQADAVTAELVSTRGKLELEIMNKRRSIILDRDRGQLLRSYFPSAKALTGS